MSLIAPIVAGTALGGGLTMVIAQSLPKPPPELKSAVARLNSPLREATLVTADVLDSRGDGQRTLVPEWLASWLGNSGLVRARPEDLAIVGKTTEQHVMTKLTGAIGGLLFGPLIAVVAQLAHFRLSFVFPIGLSLMLGVICFLGPDGDVSRRAAKARTEFNKVLHGYLVSVALERRANRGIIQALDEASRIGDSWVLARIRSTLLAAQIASLAPWDALEELGRTLDIQALGSAAHIMRSTSHEGTAVFHRLLTQAESLGDSILTEERASAVARSERMIIPVSMMGTVIMLMIAYPLSVLIGGGL